MNNLDFYDSNFCVRLRRKLGRLGNKVLIYALYVYSSCDGSLSYAVTVMDDAQNFNVRRIDSYSDAEEIFSLISDGEIDICSLDEVADDYLNERKDTKYSGVCQKRSKMMC